MPAYKSKFETKLAESFKKAGIKARYETLRLPYTLECVYIPDWILPNRIIIEAKGKLDAHTRRKMLAVKRTHPGRDIRFVFQRASNKIRKGSATSYGEWASKHNFKWSDGVVPADWIKEKHKSDN